MLTLVSQRYPEWIFLVSMPQISLAHQKKSIANFLNQALGGLLYVV